MNEENVLQGPPTPEDEEKLYIGSKLIRAFPMDEFTFLRDVKKQTTRPDHENRHGYKVIYPDGYESWAPKEVFETAYREVTDSERKLF